MNDLSNDVLTSFVISRNPSASYYSCLHSETTQYCPYNAHTIDLPKETTHSRLPLCVPTIYFILYGLHFYIRAGEPDWECD